MESLTGSGLNVAREEPLAKGAEIIKGLVSIIIPTHNRADYVVEAIQSVKAQKYPLTQIIVVDDGSIDDTAQRVAEIEGVEYYWQEKRSQGAARNLGLRLAEGEYIASLDSDDLWDEDFLVRSVDCLESFQLDFVFTNWVKLQGENAQPSEWLRDGKWRRYYSQSLDEWTFLNPKQIRALFLEQCPAPSSSLLMRRSSIVSGWGEHMRIADDWYLILEMALYRPCRAAFTVTPRWKKRVDGKNVYDGQPFAETVRKLYLHDYRFFGRDFSSQLTRWEKLRLFERELEYRLRLRLHRWARTELGSRLKMPALVSGIRSLMRPSINNPNSIGRGLAQDE